MTVRPELEASPRRRTPPGPTPWRGRIGDAHYVFGGRGGRRAATGDDDRYEVPGRPELPVARLRQVHGVELVGADAAHVREGDALHTAERGLALCIQTADCVPVVLAARSGVAALHAGWRGIAAGIVERVLEGLGAGPWTAVVGPAIGPCCYEVGDDVAERIAAALPRPDPNHYDRERPHVDLQAAVADQLTAAGVVDVTLLSACTRCRADDLWSYRRQGPRAGRNLSFVWRDA